jgi:hypothetical protein
MDDLVERVMQWLPDHLLARTTLVNENPEHVNTADEIGDKVSPWCDKIGMPAVLGQDVQQVQRTAVDHTGLSNASATFDSNMAQQKVQSAPAECSNSAILNLVTQMMIREVGVSAGAPWSLVEHRHRNGAAAAEPALTAPVSPAETALSTLSVGAGEPTLVSAAIPGATAELIPEPTLVSTESAAAPTAAEAVISEAEAENRDVQMEVEGLTLANAGIAALELQEAAGVAEEPHAAMNALVSTEAAETAAAEAAAAAAEAVTAAEVAEAGRTTAAEAAEAHAATTAAAAAAATVAQVAAAAATAEVAAAAATAEAVGAPEAAKAAAVATAALQKQEADQEAAAVVAVEAAGAAVVAAVAASIPEHQDLLFGFEDYSEPSTTFAFQFDGPENSLGVPRSLVSMVSSVRQHRNTQSHSSIVPGPSTEWSVPLARQSVRQCARVESSIDQLRKEQAELEEEIRRAERVFVGTWSMHCAGQQNSDVASDASDIDSYLDSFSDTEAETDTDRNLSASDISVSESNSSTQNFRSHPATDDSNSEISGTTATDGSDYTTDTDGSTDDSTHD